MTILNKNSRKKKNCVMWTHSFITHIKTEDFYEDIADDVEKKLKHQIMNATDYCLWEKTKKILD